MQDFDYKPAKDMGLPPGERLKSLKRESGLIECFFQQCWWAFIRLYLALYHRLEIVGREHIPRGLPFVLIANHASHLDAMVLAAPLPWRVRSRIFPIAAGDVFFETPLLTAFAGMALNALPMWRKNCGPHALKELRARLVEEPAAYILFPEGARSRDGRLLPFKSGLGMIVAGTDVPVVPCYLDGAFEAHRPDTVFPRPRKVRLIVGKPLNFAGLKNRREGWDEAIRQLEAAVRELGGVATDEHR